MLAVVPVHLKGGDLPGSSTQHSIPFKRLTIANLKPQSELEGFSIYWLHFALAYVFVIYSLWLMDYHYKVCNTVASCLYEAPCSCSLSGLRHGRLAGVQTHGCPCRRMGHMAPVLATAANRPLTISECPSGHGASEAQESGPWGRPS